MLLVCMAMTLKTQPRAQIQAHMLQHWHRLPVASYCCSVSGAVQQSPQHSGSSGPCMHGAWVPGPVFIVFPLKGGLNCRVHCQLP